MPSSVALQFDSIECAVIASKLAEIYYDGEAVKLEQVFDSLPTESQMASSNKPSQTVGTQGLFKTLFTTSLVNKQPFGLDKNFGIAKKNPSIDLLQKPRRVHRKLSDGFSDEPANYSDYQEIYSPQKPDEFHSELKYRSEDEADNSNTLNHDFNPPDDFDEFDAKVKLFLALFL